MVHCLQTIPIYSLVGHRIMVEVPISMNFHFSQLVEAIVALRLVEIHSVV